MKSKKEIDDITDTLIDFGVNMAISAMMLKVISDAYKDNPAMFWSYQKEKHRDIIYGVRM